MRVEGFKKMVICPICRKPVSSRKIRARSGKEMELWHCAQCQYDFFAHDPTASLAANKLDETRLKASGLDIPTRDADFANGLQQSKPLIDEYLNEEDKGKKILEIGCSWGYFLKLAQDLGASPYGIEVNTIRAKSVNDDLGIPCFLDLKSCESSGFRFHKIFLFYVLEYIPKPVEYLQRLINMLDEGGSLIVITPNLDDVLKDLYRNEGFRHFFYDEHAINYFSSQSIRQMVKRLKKTSGNVETRQGYSFVNHVNWFLTNAPRTTKVVGGDNYVRDITVRLQFGDEDKLSDWTAKHRYIAEKLAELIQEFDCNYRKLLEDNEYGNQVRFIIKK